MNAVKRIALIPAYEPNKALIDVAEGLKENGFEVLIVNDGSGSGSADILKKRASMGRCLYTP